MKQTKQRPQQPSESAHPIKRKAPKPRTVALELRNSGNMEPSAIDTQAHTATGTATLADLCEPEKAKVAKLVEEIMRLGAERERSIAELAQERNAHRSTRRKMQEALEKTRGDTAALQEKLQTALKLLRSYQSKLREFLQNEKSSAKQADEREHMLLQVQAEAKKLSQVVEEQKTVIQASSKKLELSRLSENQLHDLQTSYGQLVQAQQGEREEAAVLRKELEHKLSVAEESHKIEVRKRQQLEATCTRLEAECSQLREALTQAVKPPPFVSQEVSRKGSGVVDQTQDSINPGREVHNSSPVSSEILREVSKLRYLIGIHGLQSASQTEQDRANGHPMPFDGEHGPNGQPLTHTKHASIHIPRQKVVNPRVTRTRPSSDSENLHRHKLRTITSTFGSNNLNVQSEVFPVPESRHRNAARFTRSQRFASDFTIDEGVTEAATVLSDPGYYEDSLFQLVELLDSSSAQPSHAHSTMNDHHDLSHSYDSSDEDEDGYTSASSHDHVSFVLNKR